MAVIETPFCSKQVLTWQKLHITTHCNAYNHGADKKGQMKPVTKTVKDGWALGTLLSSSLSPFRWKKSSFFWSFLCHSGGLDF
jgi:hypothetical protein